MHRILSIACLSAVVLGSACSNSSDGEFDDATESETAAQLFAKSSAEQLGCEGERVALQTHNGKNYLTALAGGSLGILASATKVGRAETFKVYELGFGRVALQAANARFVSWGNGNAQASQQRGGNGGQVDPSTFFLSASSFAIDQSAAFRVAKSKDGKWVSLQAVDGRYVGAPGGGGSVADVAWPLIGENQQFKAICVDEKGADDGAKPGSDDDGDVSSARPGLGG